MVACIFYTARSTAKQPGNCEIRFRPRSAATIAGMGRKLPNFMSESAPEQLLRATTRERDRILLLVALYCGLRCSELTGLRVEDLEFTRRTLFVRQGKGKKDRVTPIPKKIVGPLRGWVGNRTTGLVFPSPRGNGRLTNRTVQYLFKRLAVAAGLPNALEPRKYRPHAMRHAYASRLLATGATILEVSELLGHASISTTQTYVHTTQEHLKQAADRI